MEMNVVFFADDGEHALDVVERMIKFMLNVDYSKETHPEVLEMKRAQHNRYLHLLDNKEKWIVTLAPKNQVYKVGWAANDTV